jgi:hypothetical protein
MPEPIVYDVAPAQNGWIVQLPGDSLSEQYESKSEAVARARHLAVRDRAGVRVLTEAGRVEVEYGPPEPGART